MSVERHLEEYLCRLQDAIVALSREDMSLLGETLFRAYRNNKQVFLLGNGGSSSTASHMAADLAKPSQTKPKVFVVPGLMKVTAQYKPPSPERPGKNPFTGEMITIKAKPASTKIRIRALKQLKQMV